LPPSDTPTPAATVDPLDALPPTPTFTAPPGLPDEANRAIDLAISDATDRFELARDELSVLGLKIVTWRIPALTCNNNPLGYGALATERNAGLPGFRLILGDESPRALVYFTDLGGEVIYCPNANLLDERGTALYADPSAREFAELALTDLSRRLNISPNAIRAVDTLTLTWLDSSLGCPQADSNPTAQQTPGYRIVLAFRANIYIYHTNDLSVTPCPQEREILPRPFQATPTPAPTAIPES
jgi:hypothetical protein